jgi:translocation and assembly module TamB
VIGLYPMTALSGRMRADARVAGTLSAPKLSGELAIDGLGFTVVATGVKYRDGRVALHLLDRSIELSELALNGGALRGGGRVDVAAPHASFDLWVALADLPVLDRAEGEARASGKLALGGDWLAPTLRGALVLNPATLHPSLVPGGDASRPDPTIVVLRSAADEARAAERETMGDVLREANGQAPPQPPDQSLWARTSVELKATLGPSVFVRRNDAEVRLDGELYATKEPTAPIVLTGQITSQRGWYVFQGRRLTLEHAYVLFSGESPIDPYLDVLAVYRSPQYRVSVAVQGTVRKPTLMLSSEPPLDQSDILAVLLFGKPTSELSGGQGQDLQQQAVALLASYVAPQLEKSVRDTFGLTSVTFQMPSGSTAGTVGIGRYFGQDLFVSLAQDFGGPQGGTPRQLQGLVGSSVTVQYYLTPSFTLQGAASSQGESAIDLIWQKRY